MPDTPDLETMRSAIAEIIADIECGVLAWHDIGERATNALAQLRAALQLLTVDTSDIGATQFLMTPARIRIAARRVEDTYPDTASYLRDLAKVFDIEMTRLTATTEQSSAVARSGTVPARHVLVPVEVRDFYEFAAMVFEPFTPQQEQLKVSLKKAQAAMQSAAAPEPPQGEVYPGDSARLEIYAAVARVVALHLKEFCDESLTYADMIADAARKAGAEIERLRADTPRSGDAPVAYEYRVQYSNGNWGNWGPAPKDSHTFNLIQRYGSIEGMPAELRALYTASPADAIAVAWTYTDATGRTHYTANKTRSDATPLYPHPSAFRGAPADARDGEQWARAYEFVTSILPLDPERKHWVRDPTNPMGLAEQDRHRVDLLVASRDANAEDARRYRWLRGGHDALCATKLDGELNQVMVVGEELDRKIDSAMGAGGGE